MDECYINGVQYTCRTCFDPGRTVYALADECRNSKTWRDLLNDVAKIKTNDDELLPKTVCGTCLDKLVGFYDFILQIENVNKKYSQLLTSADDSSNDGNSSRAESGLKRKIEDDPMVRYDDAALLLSQCAPKIKFEHDPMVPYDDAAYNAKIPADKIEKLANEDAYNLSKESLNADIIPSFEELQKKQRTLNEEINQLYQLNELIVDDYVDVKIEKSSMCSDESECQYEDRTEEENINKSSTSMKRRRRTSKIDEPISEKKFKSFDMKSYIHSLFKQQTEILCKQNKTIMNVLAEQTVLTKNLIKQDETSNYISKSFPISSKLSLSEIDAKIKEHNKHLYVEAVKDIIKNNFIKNIGLIISEDLLYLYNLDGTHGKGRLKDFKNLYSAIEDAVKAIPNICDCEGYIRKAINLIKKRHLKKILKERELQIKPCAQVETESKYSG